MIIGLPSTMLAGTLLTIIGSDQLSVTIFLIAGLSTGCICGLLIGRVRGRPPQAQDPTTLTPRSVLKTDRWATLATIGTTMAASGLATAIAFQITRSTPANAALVVGLVGLLSGLSAGVIIARFTNARSSWLSYSAARIYLAARRDAPWRTMRFFETMYRRGIFRQAGNLYQFRHARLQDHLADD